MSRQKVLFLMNRWMSTAGGIQTVNRELACAVATLYPNIDCVAIVTKAEAYEREDARARRVMLIAGDVEDDWTTVFLSRELSQIPAEEVLAVVGHSYFSGRQAITLRDSLFPQAIRAHFVHMNPLDTESLKEYREDSYVRDRELRFGEELEIAQQADLVFCIGPRLWRYMRDQMVARRSTQAVERIDCGLYRPNFDRPPAPAEPTLLYIGRTDSVGVKGLDIFAYSAGYLARLWAKHPWPRYRPAPRFVVRGAKKNPEELERYLVSLSAETGSEARIKVRPYTTNASDLLADYLGSSVVFMPSREEGFGLVGCEALSLGIPVLVSSASGLADVIHEVAQVSHIRTDRCVIESRGTAHEIGQKYAEASFAVLLDEDYHAAYIRQLREQLLVCCSWESGAHRMVACIEELAKTQGAPVGVSGSVPRTTVLDRVPFEMEHVQPRFNLPARPFGSAPPPPKLIIGREDDIHALKSRLSGDDRSWSGPSLTVLRGWPGVGKTTLASALAYDSEVSAMFPDGVLWASLGQHPNLFAELGGWARALGIAGATDLQSAEEVSANLAEVLRGQRRILIIDDVWVAEHVELFRIGGRDCALIVTTRLPEIAREVAPTLADIYIVGVLSTEKCLELLGLLAPQVVASHYDLCRELVEDLEGLPLAIQVAGRLLQAESTYGCDVATLLEEIREGARVIQAKAPSDRSDLSKYATPTVAALLQKSTDLLDGYTSACFSGLGVFAPKPATFDLRAVGAVWGVGDPTSIIRKLVDYGLLEPVENGRFWMHALLVAHAKSMLSGD